MLFTIRLVKKHFDKDVDKFFSDETESKRVGKAILHIKPCKAFIKKHRALFDEIDYNIDCPQNLKYILQKWEISNRSFFNYYNTSYPVSDIIYAFVAKYICAIIGHENLHYIGGRQEIINYVDDVLKDFY